MAEAGHHSSYLPIPAFRQDDLQSSSITIAVENVHLACKRLPCVNTASRPSVREDHSLSQSIQRLVGEFSANDDLVLLLDSMARVCKPGSQCTIVGQDEEPG